MWPPRCFGIRFLLTPGWCPVAFPGHDLKDHFQTLNVTQDGATRRSVKEVCRREMAYHHTDKDARWGRDTTEAKAASRARFHAVSEACQGLGASKGDEGATEPGGVSRTLDQVWEEYSAKLRLCQVTRTVQCPPARGARFLSSDKGSASQPCSIECSSSFTCLCCPAVILY